MENEIMVDGFAAKLCLNIARMFLRNGKLKRFGFRNPEVTRFDSMEDYISNRIEQIKEYQILFRPYSSFENKTVLEIGCSYGYLLQSFLEEENFRAIGADIDPEVLAAARKEYGDRIQFIQSTPDTIPLPDACIDIIYTIDTVEHLSRPHEMFAEFLRVLRPGGICFVYFHGWYGPYGSHLEDIIPFPWANVLFSMDTLLTVAAYLYESPDYEIACYYIDQNTGNRKPNPYLDISRWNDYLNHISIRQFRKIIHSHPFEILHLENIGFGGKSYRFGRYLKPLSKVPILEEFFTKATFAVLKKTE